MPIRLGDIYVAVRAQSQQLDSDLASVQRRVEKWTRDLRVGIAQGMGQAIFNTVTRALGQFNQVVGDAIQNASNLREAIDLVSVVFGESADEIVAWSKTAATALGQSQRQALQSAGTFGNMFTSMGVARDEAAEMSKALVTLASDLASLNNIEPWTALEKLRSGIAGELEPVRTLGIDLSVLRVETKALEMGLAATTKEITAQDKVLARYAIIMEQTVNAQGNFNDTSQELANSQRILTGQLEDASAALGRYLLPIRLEIVQGMSDLIRDIAPFGRNIMESLAFGLAEGITALLPVMRQLRAFFVYWLKPGSPPRLLKDLTAWGKGAMQAYLEGWTEADFSALQEVGASLEKVLRSFAGSGQIEETDLVSRVFGSQKAIVNAIREFRDLGVVSVKSLDKIRKAAGPAGDAVADLIREFFELQRATRNTAAAQDELNAVTEAYADALNPITDKLEAVRAKQQEIRDNQRLEELGAIIADPRADVDERRLARLEAEEIQLERQARALENERDVAVDAAQLKLDAAQAEEDAQRKRYALAQATLDQQVKSNDLLAEEINLRQRLAAEALAEQEKAARELEQQLRKETEEIERILDAQLRWRLASTDTEGQLAIMRAELAKTVAGSADYYDILTEIIQLEERLTRERETGANLFDPIDQATGGTGVLQETSEGIKALSEALDKAFAIISGEEQKPVELNPFWTGVIQVIEDIGATIERIKPIVQGFIDLFTGEEVAIDETGQGTGFFSSIVPGLNGLLGTLKLIRDGEWVLLWDKFKETVQKNIDDSAAYGDADSLALYTWIKDDVIPLFEAFTEEGGGWKTVWDEFKEAVDEAINTSAKTGDEESLALYTWMRDIVIPLFEAFVDADGPWTLLWEKFNKIVDNAIDNAEKTGDAESLALYLWIRDDVIPLFEAFTSEEGPWTLLWQKFKEAVDGNIDNSAKLGDAESLALYTWIRDDVIPLFEAFSSDAGPWTLLWQRFKEGVDKALDDSESLGDEESLALYTWMRDTIIPAFELLAKGAWTEAWDLFEQAPLNAVQNIIDKIQELFDIEARVEEFMRKFDLENPNPQGPLNPTIPGEDVLPPSPHALIPNLAPALASSTVMNGNTYQIQINQAIDTRGDFGGARQGAQEGIRQALIERTLNG